MRAYFFGNMYLSSIQQGIQAAHVVGDMFVKYSPSCGQIKDTRYPTLLDWAANHKTMILLNAGYGEEIHSLVEFFNTEDNPYPWAQFHEAPEALDGALTSVGIVLPERIYETVSLIREGKVQRLLLNNHTLTTSFGVPNDFTDWELDLIDRLPNYGLAK